MALANTHPIEWKKLSSKIEEHFPDFIRTEGPLLVAFLKAYYEWMDDTSNQNYALRNLNNWRDVDRSLDRFTDWFHNEFMVRIPKDVQVNRILLLKHIQALYRAKGTQQAYRLLFRVLYNEEITFYYPGSDLFRYNADAWFIERSLSCSGLVPEALIYDCVGKEIVGSGTGSRSRVEKIVKTAQDGSIIYEFFISKTVGAWSDKDRLGCGGVDVARVRTGGVIVYPGRYLSETGWDSVKRYQDSFYWQEYSYEIRSSTPLSTYRDIIKDLAHPAGSKLFGVSVINIIMEDVISDITVEIETGDTSSINEVLGLISIIINPILTANSGPTEVAAFGPAFVIQGTARVANTDTISLFEDYPLSSFVSWEISNYTDGKGLLGTSTEWSANLAGINTVLIEDTGEVYGNGTFMKVSSDSANTMSIGPAYFSLAGNNLSVSTY